MVQAATDPIKYVVLSSPLKGCSSIPEGAAQQGGWAGVWPLHHHPMDVKPELQTHQGSTCIIFWEYSMGFCIVAADLSLAVFPSFKHFLKQFDLVLWATFTYFYIQNSLGCIYVSDITSRVADVLNNRISYERPGD